MRNSGFLSVLAVCVLLVCCPTAPAADNTFTNDLGMEFVLIKPGTFMMGSPADEPDRNQSEKPHRVTIAEPFYMQATEVTIGQWQEVMGKKWLFARKGPKNRPVTGVSWHDCRDFVRKLSNRLEGTYRLPTEAQWEYACRAGTQTVYSWGDEIDCSDAMFANSPLKSDRCVEAVKNRGLEPGAPAPVKSYSPNAWGIYDMHGNVWEWCRDCFDAYTRSKKKDNRSCSRYVRRGGSWYSSAHNLRSANRAWAHPASKFKTTGFRVIKEAP